MIDSDYVRQFFPMMDQRRPALVYRPADQLADGAADPVWFKATIRKEPFSVRDQAAFSGTDLALATQVYSILEAAGDTTPQAYRGVRIYDKEDRAWFSVVAVGRTASDALQTVYCAPLKPGLTPQLALTGDA